MSPPTGAGAGPLPARRAVAVLLAVHAVSFLPFLPTKGFASDDWVFLDALLQAKDGTFPSLVAAFDAKIPCPYRPLTSTYYAGLHLLGGTTPWPYHAALFAFHGLAALFLFDALRRACGRVGPAFLAACLFVVYPNHGSTHHWYASPGNFALLTWALSLDLHLVWTATRRILPLAGSLSSLAAGLLVYESALPLVILMPVLGAWLLRRQGATPGTATKAAAATAAPILALTAGIALYQQVVVARTDPGGFARPVRVDPAFAAKVLGRAVDCSSTRLVDLAAKSATAVAARPTWPLWTLAVAASAIAALSLWRATRPDEGRPPDARAGPWLATGCLAFVAGYAPYAVSAQRWIPQIFSEQNRINAPGTVGASIVLAGLLLGAESGLRRLRAPPRVARAAPAALFTAFLALSSFCNWNVAYEWGRAYELQGSILDAVAGASARIPPGPAALVLEGAPSHVGKAPAFHVPWGFPAALRIRTGRRDLVGIVGGLGEEVPPGHRAFVYDWGRQALEERP